ncbi:FAD-dependent oxidoreductase [Halobacterium zhouii]|uniref:FAD-dependent oxidoreductase n=1 Tax=Halobacterium zhouii TaxID=2902624 RepID=UPI001E5CC718|nr:FAD-dependent oxidoreductase [Halobacterium zhouii]
MPRNHDAVVVGGGPAGASAAVFLGRAGLDVLVCDRGRASLDRCAHLENYLGFPGGVSVSTFRDLTRRHLEETGCAYADDHVSSITRVDGDLLVEREEGDPVRTDRVLATTKYGAEYLHALDDGDLFRGADRRHVAADDDGRTAVEGVYAAGPLVGTTDQAIVAAGDGADVATTLVEDWLVDERDFWRAIAVQYWDWVRYDTERTDDRREHIESWVRDSVPDDENVSEERIERVTAFVVEHDRSQFVDDEERTDREEHGREQLRDVLNR